MSETSARYIRAIDIWGRSPSEQDASLEGCSAAQVGAEISALDTAIELNQKTAAVALDAELTRLVEHYDCAWELHNRIQTQAGYALVNSTSDARDLRTYSQVSQKVLLGREGREVLNQLDTIDREMRRKGFQACFTHVEALLSRSTDLFRLSGLRAHVLEETDSMISAALAAISKTLLNDASPSYEKALELLELHSSFKELRGIWFSDAEDGTDLVDNVAHALWFKMEKWKLATPPDLKWLELEACKTASTIYYCWTNTRARGGTADTKESRSESALLQAGLSELFFRYLSYRSQDDIMFRARDFAQNVVDVACDAEHKAGWRVLVRKGVRRAWDMAVSRSELLERTQAHRDIIKRQLAEMSNEETCPVDGVDVQIQTFSAVKLIEELIDRVNFIMSDENQKLYLEGTLNQAVVKKVLEDLKAQWNDMVDPWEDQNLTKSIAVYNSLCHLGRCLREAERRGGGNGCDSVWSTINRINELFKEEIDECGDPAKCEMMIRRFQKEVLQEDTRLIKCARLSDECM